MLIKNHSRTCIFINSCDKTHDVAIYFLKSYEKYIKNNYFDVFIGVNDNKHHIKYNFLNYIYTPKSNWKVETLYQLKYLKNKYGYKNVIHILDDFIFSDYSDLDYLMPTLDKFENKKIPYLCLKKMNESFITNLVNIFKTTKDINKVRYNYPYYSSLQISIWNIDYFIENINHCKSIWNFERQQLSKEHYQVKKDFFHYRHIVEKGEWDYGSAKYVEKYVDKFYAGKRPFKYSLFGKQIYFLKKLSFYFFGFLIMRIKGN